MVGVVFGFVAGLITVGSLTYAGKTLIKNKAPMYYKLPIGAVGCFALHQVSVAVTELCGGSYIGDPGISVIGVFGCFCFILSANYGQLDGIVDDKSSGSSKARTAALLAPAVDAVLIVLAYLSIGNHASPLTKAVFIIVLLPILPASYFCLKHLLLPVDEFGFLASSRMYNGVSLAAGLMCIGYLRVLLTDDPVLKGICMAAMSAAMLGLVLACRKGVKIWRTLA